MEKQLIASIVVLAVVAFPGTGRAQVLTGRDSADLGKALAAYIRVHPDVQIDGTPTRLIIDTTSGSITASVGVAFRLLAPDHWQASPGAGENVRVHFNIGMALFWGDSLTVTGSWSDCPPGVPAVNGHVFQYHAVRDDSGWKIVRHNLWLLGRNVCASHL